MDISNYSQKSNRNLINNSQYSRYPTNINSLNINDIPYAKSISNIHPNYKQQNNNLSNTSKYYPDNGNNELPPIPKTPYQLNDTYKQAYDNCNQAKGLIQTRLNKLMYEKKLLGEIKQNYNPYSADYESLYQLKSTGNAKGKLSNPHLYSNQFMDPIYYPLEMPITGEPVTLPRIEIGGSLRNKNCCGGLGLEELLALFAALRKRRPPPQVIQPPQKIIVPEYSPNTHDQSGNRKKIINKKKNLEDLNKKVVIPENKKKKERKKIPIKRDWWKLCRDFCNVYAFFSTGRKYSGFAKIRDNIIDSRIRSLVQDITVLKQWVISITQSFWDEFKVFTDLNVSFKNLDNKIKITKESQKIIAMIRKYLESLIANSTKLIDIPERVQQILYSYIKDRCYFPKNYLSTYQINRIDYNFYGGTKNLQADQVGMLLALLIISSITVQQILLHMKDCFVDFKNYPNIEISAKFIGSIMHYLVRDTFSTDPTMIKDYLALINYYRNYHIYNKEVEGQSDIFHNNLEFKDIDEFADYLVPESTITEFWNLNAQFVDMFKNYVYSWATKLGKLIRLKFEKSDPNLLPKRGFPKPKDRTAIIEEEKKEEELENVDGVKE